jgi:hypothetical protein
MYLQKVISKKNMEKIHIFLKVTDKRAGSLSGAVGQRYGSVDPDPYQNVTDS